MKRVTTKSSIFNKDSDGEKDIYDSAVDDDYNVAVEDGEAQLRKCRRRQK